MTTTNDTVPDQLSSITDGVLGALPTKVLVHGASGARAEILLLGATVLSWRAPWHGGLAELMDGYLDEEDVVQQRGGRAAILFPFANRLRDDRYTFDGVTREMGLQYPADKEVIHGAARVAQWTLVEEDVSDPHGVSVTLAYSLRSGDITGYPFSLDATARFSLTATGLDLVLSFRNVGDVDAPVSAGWHPYFRLPGHASIDGLSLHVPARTAIVTDETLVPVPGNAAYRPLPDGVHDDRLEGVVHDNAWADLVADADGRVRTLLSEPGSGDGIAVWQTRGTVVVFTGDTVPRPRESVAIEPLETMTDAFNRPERDADVRLAAGAERTFACGVEVVTGR
ncbi:aldose 1-epimerase [Sanguibacter antarcticus]|uniref:Aldose 1-epimerase n=1 Tax=Sanguibacter antarcticus TaxID=372484 RepID=A0A2A9E663_9MICO|nr:aldose 1-epimerase [Sanguibacter antarcticus]PFG33845.1 aldose 1-epimerase [Sanguibacter antarcticus]